MFTYNRDRQSRDRILFGVAIDWEQQFGDIKRFEGIAFSQLEQLVAGGFANPQDRHNVAPSIAASIEFAREWARCGVTIVFEGYAVHPLRDDYRVSIDGLIPIQCEAASKNGAQTLSG